ncbi:hypothetical protein [Promicromonospora sp. NPDC050880]|uniref:hypothetical protein n=1 Tax=Promicromonospora sp. NPDC050880 TaxID=3364406 RepID=UPI0037887AA6
MTDALVLTAAMALPVAAAGYAVAVITAPEPETRTVMLDAPPACAKIGPAVQAERARAARVDEAAAAVLAASEELADVVLSADPDAVIEQAEAVDAALRDEQQAKLDLATAQTTTDAVVGDCTPERDQ